VKQLSIGLQESFTHNPHTVGPSAAGLGARRRGNGKHHMRGNCRNIMRHNCRRQQRDYCQPENYRRHLSTTHHVRQMPTIFTCLATFGPQVSLGTEYTLCETTATICETLCRPTSCETPAADNCETTSYNHEAPCETTAAHYCETIADKHCVPLQPTKYMRQLPTSIMHNC
jgi:hypothetical protein